jgi:hypothetical protein
MMPGSNSCATEVNIRFAMAVALFMAQAGCGRLGGPRTENWGSYPDGNVKAEWLPDGRSMKLIELSHL